MAPESSSDACSGSYSSIRACDAVVGFVDGVVVGISARFVDGVVFSARFADMVL